MKQFPRHPLTFGPSPVHPLDRLSDHLGGARIWAKREDVNSGLAFGGNKTRKLEYIVPDVLASGADTLVSIGGVQSNHTRQVAAVAAHLGLKCRLVQERWVDWDDPVKPAWMKIAIPSPGGVGPSGSMRNGAAEARSSAAFRARCPRAASRSDRCEYACNM